ncbi:protein of unknown function [Lentzea waywayandensis]|uniref:DUF1963 domain-containing protein n=1 Tax=Lentzea waywayandensis TaxID=84724 RepID=A0A1I6DEH4_9PSEU|nr:DUF1963 domain-containing protein [Lentzea waywayandensis]SFR03771.1 protein of unknown function [Lentzea waywayandensis]
MNPRNVKILDQIRTEALVRGIPEPDVERWMELVRPSALLTLDGDGPVVGRFGGPIMLPADVETQQYPLVATFDCAALPREATDLPLPSDGRLLFFGYPEEHGMGEVVYVPEGAAVVERELDPESYPACSEDFAENHDEFPQGDIHLTIDVSLPFVGTVGAPPPVYLVPMPGHPHAEALAEVWADQWGGAALVLGGYGTDCNGSDATEIAVLCAAAEAKAQRWPGGGTPSSDAGDWVLLLEFNVYRSGGGAAIFWVIQREDLIAQRFDRTQVLVDWNP